MRVLDEADPLAIGCSLLLRATRSTSFAIKPITCKQRKIAQRQDNAVDMLILLLTAPRVLAT